ncbi:hypothetical protein ACIBF1_01635 [Spirillospora sp. NPDC050679]
MDQGLGHAVGLARQSGFALGPALATAGWALSGYTLNGMRAGLALAVVATPLALLALRAATRPREAAVSSPA